MKEAVKAIEKIRNEVAGDQKLINTAKRL